MTKVGGIVEYKQRAHPPGIYTPPTLRPVDSLPFEHHPCCRMCHLDYTHTKSESVFSKQTETVGV